MEAPSLDLDSRKRRKFSLFAFLDRHCVLCYILVSALVFDKVEIKTFFFLSGIEPLILLLAATVLAPIFRAAI